MDLIEKIERALKPIDVLRKCKQFYRESESFKGSADYYCENPNITYFCDKVIDKMKKYEDYSVVELEAALFEILIDFYISGSQLNHDNNYLAEYYAIFMIYQNLSIKEGQ